MRMRYRHLSGAGEKLPGGNNARAIPLEWHEEWLTNLCLGVILAAMLFLMLFSIYLVITKPAPALIPEDTETWATGSVYVQVDLPDRSAHYPNLFFDDFSG